MSATQLEWLNGTAQLKVNMKFPESNNRTGLSTLGLAGCVVLAGVVFQTISPWWILASIMLLLMGVGLESGRSAND